MNGVAPVSRVEVMLLGCGFCSASALEQRLSLCQSLAKVGCQLWFLQRQPGAVQCQAPSPPCPPPSLHLASLDVRLQKLQNCHTPFKITQDVCFQSRKSLYSKQTQNFFFFTENTAEADGLAKRTLRAICFSVSLVPFGPVTPCPGAP